MARLLAPKSSLSRMGIFLSWSIWVHNWRGRHIADEPVSLGLARVVLGGRINESRPAQELKAGGPMPT